jgi:hypothetical protein
MKPMDKLELLIVLQQQHIACVNVTLMDFLFIFIF